MRYEDVVFGGLNCDQDYVPVLKDWLKNKKTLVITGPSGSGKTCLFWRIGELLKTRIDLTYTTPYDFIYHLRMRKIFCYDNVNANRFLVESADWISSNRVAVAFTTHAKIEYDPKVLTIKLNKLDAFLDFTSLFKTISDNHKELFEQFKEDFGEDFISVS